MDIKGFKDRDGNVHQYDYDALSNRPGNIPGGYVDLTGYATEEFVRNKIAEAQMEGGNVDLSGFVRTVNGVAPDGNGNVTVGAPDGNSGTSGLSIFYTKNNLDYDPDSLIAPTALLDKADVETHGRAMQVGDLVLFQNGTLATVTAIDTTTGKVICKAVAKLAASPGSAGLTTAQINALDGMFKVCAYDDSKDVSGAYAAFKTAFGLPDSGGEEPDNPSEPDEPDVPVVTTYTITNNLTDVVSSNTDTSVGANTAYSATLTAADGFTMDGATVTITMGGVDITATAYSNGVVSISAVTGNVVITATAAMQGLAGYTITNNLSGVSNSNTETTINEGGTYTATLTADGSHVLPDVDMGGTITVTMGGVDITNSVYSYKTGAITIAPVTGSIVITVNAANMPAIIEGGLQDFFDYRNAAVNADGDIESVIGNGLILNVGTTEIADDGFILNHNYDPTGTRTDYKAYDGTNHEWTAIFCILMGSSGTYSVPFPNDEIVRTGTNHYPIGNYYNTAGTEVSIASNTAVKNDVVGAMLIGIIRNSATARAFYVAKQNNAAVERVAIFNASDYSDFAYFSPLSYRHRTVSRTVDKAVMTAIYNRALTDEEIAEVVRYIKMEVV